jgi:hypothetical protein
MKVYARVVTETELYSVLPLCSTSSIPQARVLLITRILRQDHYW